MNLRGKCNRRKSELSHRLGGPSDCVAEMLVLKVVEPTAAYVIVRMTDTPELMCARGSGTCVGEEREETDEDRVFASKQMRFGSPDQNERPVLAVDSCASEVTSPSEQ